MLKDYVSDAKQMLFEVTLETLRLRSLMKEKKIDHMSEGLTKIVEHMNGLSLQCPPDFSSDAHKIGYHRKEVSEFED